MSVAGTAATLAALLIPRRPRRTAPAPQVVSGSVSPG
jgi:hypothetical protein